MGSAIRGADRSIEAWFLWYLPELGARLLTWRELERMVCGQPDVSVEALKRIARCEGSYKMGDEHMENLWDVLRSFSGEERKKFLGFVWGRGRLPANPTQPFTIDSSGGSDDSKLPRSHTCMFQLHLPKYSTKELLRSRLLTAFQNHGDGQTKSPHVPSEEELLVKDTAATPTVVLQIPADAGHSEGLEHLFARMGLSQQIVAAVKKDLEVSDVATLFQKEKTELENFCLQRMRLHRLAPGVAAEQADAAAAVDTEAADVLSRYTRRYIAVQKAAPLIVEAAKKHEGSDESSGELTRQSSALARQSSTEERSRRTDLLSALPPPIGAGGDAPRGPVSCGDSSGDDEESGIVKIKLGTDDVGVLGITLVELPQPTLTSWMCAIATVEPNGLAQFRCASPLDLGMVLCYINGVAAERLTFEHVLELTGLNGGGDVDIRGICVTFQHLRRRPQSWLRVLSRSRSRSRSRS